MPLLWLIYLTCSHWIHIEPTRDNSQINSHVTIFNATKLGLTDVHTLNYHTLLCDYIITVTNFLFFVAFASYLMVSWLILSWATDKMYLMYRTLWCAHNIIRSNTWWASVKDHTVYMSKTIKPDFLILKRLLFHLYQSVVLDLVSYLLNGVTNPIP